MSYQRSLWQTWIVFLFVFVACAFTIVASYPGFMSPDSIDQYAQAKKNQYTDWHPPLMAWIWNKLLWIKDGPQPLLFLNNILYWVSILIIALKIRRFGLVLLLLLLSIAPPLINFIGVIWKDTFLFGILFFQCSLLYYFQDASLKWFYKIILVSVLLVLNLVAVMLRYNAASAILPLMILILLFVFQNIKLRYAIVFGFLFSSILFLLGLKLNKKLCNNESLHSEQQLMVYDLMGIAQAKNQNLLLPEYLKKKLSIDTLKTVYSPCDGGMFVIFNMGCTTSNPAQLDSLKECWKKATVGNPAIVVKHKWASFHCLLVTPGLTSYPYIHPNQYGFELNSHNALRKLYVRMIESEFSQTLYKSWYYLLGCVIVFLLGCALFIHRKRRSILWVVFIAASGLFYTLSYLPLSPCNDFRYNYWTIGALLLSTVLFFDELLNKKGY